MRCEVYFLYGFVVCLLSVVCHSQCELHVPSQIDFIIRLVQSAVSLP